MNAEPNRFTYIDALWQSFFSHSLYIDVARRWRGVGFLYLLLIVILSWLPDLAKMQIGLQRVRDDSIEALIRQVPAITITDSPCHAPFRGHWCGWSTSPLLFGTSASA